MDHNEDAFDLYALDGDMTVEELPQGNALGCWFTAATASTASCPATSASCVGTASTFG
ncbi:thiocillin family RiPP [Streptomyces sp. NPDC005963]|uniref:thiocillin family RiPP n=1 Tax=Streptomyces sp. NPDC005963 TaxID=3156721 RepID=UPI0033F03539